MQSQKAVTAHFTNKQLLPFAFAEQYCILFSVYIKSIFMIITQRYKFMTLYSYIIDLGNFVAHISILFPN